MEKNATSNEKFQFCKYSENIPPSMINSTNTFLIPNSKLLLENNSQFYSFKSLGWMEYLKGMFVVSLENSHMEMSYSQIAFE